MTKILPKASPRDPNLLYMGGRWLRLCRLNPPASGGEGVLDELAPFKAQKEAAHWPPGATARPAFAPFCFPKNVAQINL